MKIKCIVIDDEAYVRSELRTIIGHEFSHDISVVAEFSDPAEAVNNLLNYEPDLLFLDIQMPGMSGFEMLDKLDSRNFEVIFITSYNQYAIQAIKYSALDYLLKPIGVEDLRAALERYERRKERSITQLRLENLRHNMSAEENQFKLVIPTKHGEHQFAARDIIHCEADSNYTVIYSVPNRKFVASKTLSDIEDMLSPERFLRIHKSHLVNTDHILELTAADELMVTGEVKLPVSRRRLQAVKGVIKNQNMG